jgi:hypothetical protein
LFISGLLRNTRSLRFSLLLKFQGNFQARYQENLQTP